VIVPITVLREGEPIDAAGLTREAERGWITGRLREVPRVDDRERARHELELCLVDVGHICAGSLDRMFRAPEHEYRCVGVPLALDSG
jgi:hypothetical protein